MTVRTKIFLIATIIIGPLIDLNLFIYTLFALMLLLGRSINIAPKLVFVITLVISGVISETLIKINEEALIADTSRHVLIFAGFYLGEALGWILLLRVFSFSLKQTFITQGILGILLEQEGAIFRAGLTNFSLGLILWAYTLIIYGSVVGIAYLASGFQTTQKFNPWFKYPIAWLILTASIYLTFALWQGLVHIILEL